MGLLRINHQPSRGQLAVFGVLWLLFLGGWAAFLWFRYQSGAWASGLAIAAVLVPLVGLVSQGFLTAVYLGMSYLAFPIGWVISHLLLAVIFYLIMTPIGLIMKLVGYDPMHRSFDPQATTYWIVRENTDDRQRYFRQY